MEWTDDGIVLSVKRYGESSAVVNLLTRRHGRHAGLMRGASSKRTRGVIQAGNLVKATWRARLADHLGSFTMEAASMRTLALNEDAAAVDALNAACALAVLTLPEREPHPAVFEAFDVFVSHLDDRHVWPALMVRWELGLIEELGFALDLSTCAVTGTRDDLSHVSPKTGRAVSRGAAAPYAERLLPLPSFLLGSQSEPTLADVKAGYRLTGHFLDAWVLAPHGQRLPQARERALHRLFR